MPAATMAVTGLLVLPAGRCPWAAALLVLHGMWLYARPEIAPVSAPVLAVLLLGLRPGPTWPAAMTAVAALALVRSPGRAAADGAGPAAWSGPGRRLPG
ncbi:hypothetical protein [Streptomyces sp. NPDC048521]|uniref:hypothetical protein n=1 Tax=Streptomyces sp. NPDC048521 TaxID=3365566 RepID=UPI003723D5F9